MNNLDLLLLFAHANEQSGRLGEAELLFRKALSLAKELDCESPACGLCMFELADFLERTSNDKSQEVYELTKSYRAIILKCVSETGIDLNN